MAVDVFPWKKSKPSKTQPRFVAGTRKHKCGQAHTNLSTRTNQGSFPNMAFSPCLRSPLIYLLVHFLLIVFTLCPVHSSQFGNHSVANQTFRPKEELRKLNAIRNRLQQINKPPVKTIQVCANYYSIHLVFFSRPCYMCFCVSFVQSPDGDIIDCVLSHKQPAFDHPLQKGHKPLVFIVVTVFHNFSLTKKNCNFCASLCVCVGSPRKTERA